MPRDAQPRGLRERGPVVGASRHVRAIPILVRGGGGQRRRATTDMIAVRVRQYERVNGAASLSPNALLRPVVADSMLPSVATIGGPAELAYFAQSEVLYRSILGRMPVALPRSGFTIFDAHSQKLMDRYGLTIQSFFHGEEALRERIAARLVPPALNHAMEEAAATVERAIEHLGRDLVTFDPTLSQALERSGKKIQYQIAKIGRKTGREALRRDARAAQEAASLYGLIFPEHNLQERVYSILPFLAKHGLDLVSHIYEAIQLECTDHRLMVI